MRVVIDTNVLVAALRSRHGASAVVAQSIGSGLFAHVVSVPLVAEYEAQLKAHAVALGEGFERANQIFQFVIATATPIEIFFTWRPVLTDPGDEMLVDLALTASADCIITHNLRDLAPARTLGVTVMSPADFLSTIGRTP